MNIQSLHEEVDIKKHWKRWKFKNTFLLIVSLVAFFYLVKTPQVDNIIKEIGNLGYVGAFFTGILFVSTFTVAPAVIILFHLADTLQPIEVALLAGLGAMIGDFIIFKFMRDKVFDELRPILSRLSSSEIKLLFKSPFFAWLLPVFGALLIASPLPDEIGVSLLGLSRVKRWQFFLISFGLNAAGIFLVVTATKL